MSVPTDQRRPSVVQYVTTAKELHRFTIKRLVRLPGKYKSYIYDPLSVLAGSVMIKTAEANGLNRLDEIESRKRKALLKTAMSNLTAMFHYVDFIFEECNRGDKGNDIIKEGSRIAWYQMIKSEMNLISGVMESDRKAISRKMTCKGDSASE